MVTLPEVDKAANAAVPVNVGEPANTNAPVPVSSVTALIRFADDGVAKKVATLAPKLLAVIMLLPSIATTPDDTLVIVVSVA